MRAAQSLATGRPPTQPIKTPTIGSDLLVLGGLYLDVLRMLRYRLVHGRHWQARLAGRLASAPPAGRGDGGLSSEKEGEDEAAERDH
ncbi:MAG TPA: hypothetical protein VFT91_06565 [Dehalococcoidia bacterium]|nr:hypothetical protein [Dehalococcoidia bacterium]